LGVPKPLTAIVSGLIASWLVTQLGVPIVPAVVVGALAWATVSGQQARRARRRDN
jgi:tetrahydromethanopterin S-methyltransferase subunit E